MKQNEQSLHTKNEEEIFIERDLCEVGLKNCVFGHLDRTKFLRKISHHNMSDRYSFWVLPGGMKEQGLKIQSLLSQNK